MSISDSIIDRVKSISQEVDINTIQLPRSVKLELSAICNHKCVYCSVPKEKIKTPFMSFEIFKKSLEECYKNNIKEVGLFHMGKGTLAPELLRFMKYAEETYPQFFDFFITTNGKEYLPLKMLVTCNIKSIKFSLNGYSREAHFKATGVDDFELILENLKKLVAWRDKIKSRTQISASSIWYNNKEQEIFFNELSRTADNVYYTQIYNHAGKVNNEFIALTKNARIIPKLCDKPCFGLYNLGHIKADGTINMCRFGMNNEFNIGNIKDGFKEAWFSDKAMEIRKRHLEDKIETCNKCLGLSKGKENA